MEIKILIFLGLERFQWSGGDANQLLFLFCLTRNVFGAKLLLQKEIAI